MNIGLEPSMSELVLHIGLPKTGTTSIQDVCFRNREVLRKRHNIRYAGFAANHSDVRALLFNQKVKKIPSIISRGYTSKEKLEAGREEARKKLSKFLRTGGGQTLLLSGENASSLNASRVERLADFVFAGNRLADIKTTCSR